jgi:hypothetical protein
VRHTIEGDELLRAIREGPEKRRRRRGRIESVVLAISLLWTAVLVTWAVW